MKNLKSVYEKFIQTEQWLDTSSVIEAWNEADSCLGQIESVIGHEQYIRIEDAIVVALMAQERSGFMVGYAYAQPAHRRMIA